MLRCVNWATLSKRQKRGFFGVVLKKPRVGKGVCSIENLLLLLRHRESKEKEDEEQIDFSINYGSYVHGVWVPVGARGVGGKQR